MSVWFPGLPRLKNLSGARELPLDEGVRRLSEAFASHKETAALLESLPPDDVAVVIDGIPNVITNAFLSPAGDILLVIDACRPDLIPSVVSPTYDGTMSLPAKTNWPFPQIVRKLLPENIDYFIDEETP